MQTETEEAKLSRGNGRWMRSVQCSCNENFPQQCPLTRGKGTTEAEQATDRQYLTATESHTTQPRGQN